jgi:MFS family permease
VAGVTVCFFLNGLSFVAVIAGLLAMREADLRGGVRLARPRSVGEVGANLGEGLRYVRRTPVVLLAVSLVGLVSIAGMNFNVLMPPMANDVLHVGASGFGFLMSAMGLGSLLAALAIAYLRRPKLSILLVGAFALGALEVVFAGVRFFPLALLAVFGVGAGAIALTATANSAIQLAVPDALRGRVMSVYTTVFAGSTPVGGLFAGWLASSFGTPVALAVGGGASALVAVGATAWVLRSGHFELPRFVEPRPVPLDEAGVEEDRLADGVGQRVLDVGDPIDHAADPMGLATGRPPLPVAPDAAPQGSAPCPP